MNSALDLTFDFVPSDAPELAIAEAGLFAHAVATGNETLVTYLHLVVRNAHGTLTGACGGQILWGDLYIDLMWVANDQRGQGIGSELLRQTEIEALRRGCFRIHLDTMSFQAPSFYPRWGYREFARLTGYPNGAERIYYVKELSQPLP